MAGDIVPFSSITNEITTPGATYRYFILDMSGTPVSGYISHANLAASVGLSYSAVSPTTGNVTAAESTAYVADISGLTANRDFVLPTPSAAGKRISLTISVGDTAYALLIKRNSTEVTRLFIAGESVEFISTGTGAGDWVVLRDGRIPCYAILERQTAQTIAHNTTTQVELATQVVDVGDIADQSAYTITIRRAGYYDTRGNVLYGAAIDDNENAKSLIYLNDALAVFAVHHSSSASQYGLPRVAHDFGLAVGDVLKLYTSHTEGGNVDTETTYGYPRLSVRELLSPIV